VNRTPISGSQSGAEKAANPNFDPVATNEHLGPNDIERLESIPVEEEVAIPPVSHKSEELESAGYGVTNLSEKQLEAKARIYKRRDEILRFVSRDYKDVSTRSKDLHQSIGIAPKGIAEYRFREQVKAELIPETVRVELEEYPKHSFYPYQLKPAENLFYCPLCC